MEMVQAPDPTFNALKLRLDHLSIAREGDELAQ